MLAFISSSDRFYGKEDSPSYLSFSATKLYACDTLARNEIETIKSKIDNDINLNLDNYIAISSGTDYNSILTPGIYVCSSIAVAQTMYNCPSGRSHISLV